MRGTPARYFHSLNRPFCVWGVERQLFFFSVGMCLPTAVAFRFSALTDLLAGILFLGFYMTGVLLTRLDPQILTLYRRHIRYEKYYEAHPGIHARIPFLRPSVPFYEGKRGII